MQVLLADESRGVRALQRGVLLQTRYAANPLIEVESGEALLAWMRTRAPGPALIIADWDLPGLDGFGILARLAEAGARNDVAVLLCLNRIQDFLGAAALRRGARGTLVRPFSDDDLLQKIESIGAALQDTRASQPSDVLPNPAAAGRLRRDLPTVMSLPSAAISELFWKATRTRHAAGETLVWPGERVDSLAFVTSGQVDAGGTIRGPGDCYAERAFVCGEPARLKVTARSTADVVRVSKERMVELARRHTSIRIFLGALILEPARPEAIEPELTGTLASLPFADLLQGLTASRKTGVLLLEEAGRQGLLVLVDGEVQDARVDGEAGETAFFRIAAWTRARFEFKAGPSVGERTMATSTMRLLMQADARIRAGEAAPGKARAG